MNQIRGPWLARFMLTYLVLWMFLSPQKRQTMVAVEWMVVVFLPVPQNPLVLLVNHGLLLFLKDRQLLWTFVMATISTTGSNDFFFFFGGAINILLNQWNTFLCLALWTLGLTCYCYFPSTSGKPLHVNKAILYTRILSIYICESGIQ